jgi:GntR family transcriptional regulator
MQPFRADKLYLQVHDHLRGLIHDGAYRPGDQLPPEVDLAAQLGVSRPTLREALLHLEQEGTIVRRHGVGTFVARRTPVFDAGIEVLESLERQANRMGLNTEVAELEVEEREPTPEEARSLGVSDGREKGVLSVSRVIAVEGQRVAHLRDVVPLSQFGREELDGDFSGSVLDVLLRRAAPVRSRTEIMADAADSQTASRLAIPAGSPLLKFVGQLYDSKDRILDYSVSLFVPGYFRFHVMRRVGLGQNGR